MTPTALKRPPTPSGQLRQTNLGHKRKGKPVEAWMMALEKAQDEESGSESLDLIAIEQIANGVERMVFSWGLDKQERRQKYAKVSKPLVKDTSQGTFLWGLTTMDDEGLDYGNAGDVRAKRDPFDISYITNTRDASSPTIQGCQRVFDTKSTQNVHLKQIQSPLKKMVCGPMSSVCSSTSLEDFSKERDEYVSSVLASEIVHPATIDFVLPSKFDCCTPNINSRNGLSTSSNSLRSNCRLTVDTLPCVENEKGGDSTCCPLISYQNSQTNSTSVFHTQNENCGCDLCTSTTQRMFDARNKGRNVITTKNTTFQPLAERLCHLRASQAIPQTPWVKNYTNVEHSFVDHIKHQSVYPLLNRKGSENESPLLSQSPLCVLSPSTRQEMSHTEEFHENENLLKRTSSFQNSFPYENGSRATHSNCLRQHTDTSPIYKRNTKPVEVGGHTIQLATLQIGNPILENKFQTLVNISPSDLANQDGHQSDLTLANAEVEELQIALLECAMEYEIKTIETKMKMHELEQKGVQQNMVIAKREQLCILRDTEKLDVQRLHQLKKQVVKLQYEKGTLNKEICTLKRKERQFEKQKSTLEDALHCVNRLQREVMKKDHEVVEWQLQEKKTKVRLQELAKRLSRAHRIQITQRLEPKKILTLLPALREWLRSLKKVGLAKDVERRQHQDEEELKVNPSFPMDGYILPPAALHVGKNGWSQRHLGPLGQLSEELDNQTDPTLNVNQVDVIICCLTKEIQALQKELTKLARS